jgi:ATP-binding cassette, subfamily B, bacterial CvaB/MchF/RaxB
MNFRLFGGAQLPLLLQTESAECGLVCLGMVAGYWGLRLDLPELRRRFALSLKGVTLKALMVMAESLALKPRALKLPLAELPALATPCILHWDMNHFVVLRSVRRGRACIHDPAAGRRQLTLQELSRHFTGIALELRPSAAFAPADEARRYALRSLMGRVTGLKRGLAQLLLLGLLLQLCALLMPFYLQWVVDEALVAADRELVTVLAIGALLLVLLQAAVGLTRSWAATALSASLNFQWLGNVHAHLLQLPLPWFERRHLGDVASRFSAVQNLQRTLTTQSVEAVIDGLLVVGTGALMCIYSAALSGIAGAAIALYALLRWLLLPALRRASGEQIVRSAQQQTQFLETVRGIQTLRLYNGAPQRHRSWLNLLAEQCNAELAMARLAVTSQFANSFLFGAERVLVIWVGAELVLRGELTIGMLFAFLSYQDQFSQRLAALIDRLCEFGLLRLQGARLADIVLAPAETTEVASARFPLEAAMAATPNDGPRHELRLCNVSFRYADTEPWVLREFSLQIPAGQFVAITGASGCGKTTLVRLLLGLYAPTGGTIEYAGQRLAGAALARFREGVGAVMQDDLLFAGSIADNITCFDPEPDPQRIVQCASWAAMHEEIAALPMNYDTQVGEAGAGVSGGQRQRLLLARALYRQPRVLVLDEATSHLDAAGERRVNTAIRRVPLTRIVIAHRAETIALADRVIVLSDGRIVSDSGGVPASDPVDKHEQAEPHHVDEVPVPGHGLEGEVALRREVTA